MRSVLAGAFLVGVVLSLRCAGPAIDGSGGNGSGGWGGWAGSGGGGSGGSGGGDGGGADLAVPTGPVTPRGAPYDNASESVHALTKVLDLHGQLRRRRRRRAAHRLRLVGRLGLSAHDAGVVDGDAGHPGGRDRQVRAPVVRRRHLHEAGRRRRHRRLHRRHRRRARFGERRAGQRHHLYRRWHQVRAVRLERARWRPIRRRWARRRRSRRWCISRTSAPGPT